MDVESLYCDTCKVSFPETSAAAGNRCPRCGGEAKVERRVRD